MYENRANPAWHEYDWFETATPCRFPKTISRPEPMSIPILLQDLHHWRMWLGTPRIRKSSGPSSMPEPGYPYALYLAIRRDSHDRDIL